MSVGVRGRLLLHLARLVEVGVAEALERLDIRLHVDRLLERPVGAVDQHGLEHHQGLQHHPGPLVGAQDGLPHGGEDDAIVRYGDAGRGKWEVGSGVTCTCQTAERMMR